MIKFKGALSVIALLAAPGLAHAQAAPEPDAGVRESEDIVVTAQRREQRLQDVPISITAMDAEMLEEAGVTDTRSLTQVIPNMVFSRANSSVQPYLRGIGTRNANVGDEPNVATYIDGVYQPVMSSVAFDLANIERVEVLRGPQGTLFGRNATGGLVNVITADPSQDSELRYTARYGTFNEHSLALYGNAGLHETLSTNLSLFYYSDDGYLENPVRGGHDGDRDAFSARWKWQVEPAPDWRLLLTLSYNNIVDGGPVSNQPYLGNTSANASAPFPVVPTEPFQSSNTLANSVGSEQVSYDFQTFTNFDGFDLETATSYQNNDSYSMTDNDGTAEQVSSALAILESEYFSTEWRLLSNDGGDFDWIAGVFYIEGTGAFDPVYSFGSTGALAARIFSEQRMQSYAVFGEGTWRPSERWAVTLGARYTWEERNHSGRTLNGAGAVTSSVSGLNDEFSQVTPRLTVQYNFNPDTQAYATYSRGFKSGLFNGFTTSTTTGFFAEPEVLDAYEIGLKSDPLPWLRANLSLFHYQYEDQQLSIRSPAAGSSTVLLNAANSEMDGAELELQFRVSDELSVRAYGTYLDATYGSFPEALTFTPITSCGAGIPPCGNSSAFPVDVSGNRMLRAPEFTVGLGFNWEHPLANGFYVGASGNAFYSDEYFWDFDNRMTQPAYTTVNGQLFIGALDDGWRLSLWGNNLTDEVVFQQMLSASQGDVVAFERPRTYGIQLSGRF